MAERQAIDLNYVEHGRGGAGPVVLLHGFPLSGAMWDDLVDALTPAYHVVVPDLRGHGKSGAPAGPYTMADYVADVAALLDRLDIERAAVIGLSMGGYVSMALGQAHPERILALVLADTKAPGDDESVRRARAEQAAQIQAEGLERFIESQIPRMLAPTTVRERPDLVERYRAIVGGTRPAAVAAALSGLSMRSDMTPALGQITCPTLVVVGAEDAVTPPFEARRIADAVPRARLVVIEGVGHMANWEAPDRFNAAVRGFLDGVLGRSPAGHLEPRHG
ncbi:MAG: alpha/beta fold hydrolase [Chloroflexi bacterium]|nr:alpha/beta fold hydrolase [Chloroflexota bacterium]